MSDDAGRVLAELEHRVTRRLLFVPRVRRAGLLGGGGVVPGNVRYPQRHVLVQAVRPAPVERVPVAVREEPRRVPAAAPVRLNCEKKAHQSHLTHPVN